MRCHEQLIWSGRCLDTDSSSHRRPAPMALLTTLLQKMRSKTTAKMQHDETQTHAHTIHTYIFLIYTYYHIFDARNLAMSHQRSSGMHPRQTLLIQAPRKHPVRDKDWTAFRQTMLIADSVASSMCGSSHAR